MKPEEILPRLRRVLETTLPPGSVDGFAPDLGLLGHGIGLDSIEILGLATAIEEEFGVVLEDEELRREHFESVGTLAEWVGRKLAGAGTATLLGRYERILTTCADRLAVREWRDWTYGELDRAAAGLASLLAELGFASGQRVALVIHNSGAFAAAFLGILRARGVAAPLTVRYRSQELEHYLRDVAPAAVLASPEALEGVRGAAERAAPATALLQMDADGGAAVRARGTPTAAPRPVAGSPALLQQYTSGSTGAPKRVVRTDANLFFELERLTRAFALDERDRLLGVAPWSHVNGLVRTLLAGLFVGATLYPLPELRRNEAVALLSRERITYLGAVPHVFLALAGAARQPGESLESLRIAFSSSAPLLEADNRRFYERFGLWVRQLYGSTETGTISVNLDADAARRPESVGRPLDGVRVEVRSPHGEPLEPDAEGELAIASPGAIAGYEGNAAATAASFCDGFYVSGDLGRRGGDGSLTLTGRVKLLINRGGFKVNPLEVEEAVLSHPKVAEAAVVGVRGPHGDDIVRCVIVAREPCTPEEIVRHCRQRIADYKVPSQVQFRDALPRSETGKLLRRELA